MNPDFIPNMFWICGLSKDFMLIVGFAEAYSPPPPLNLDGSTFQLHTLLIIMDAYAPM